MRKPTVLFLLASPASTQPMVDQCSNTDKSTNVAVGFLHLRHRPSQTGRMPDCTLLAKHAQQLHVHMLLEPGILACPALAYSMV